ncbi:class I SAM-dependent DNA methyltransferase [Lachnoanaerobaculum sp. JCM 36186]|jgi:type I restriction-modification system, methyltransferase subunit|uniref:class I SAM-dependent DNA methyltransferase n=1 Tax=Lachnoanaerobaculum sanguinis TaxID=3065809 RepID=UPI0027607572|nr:N-6 DNA methylase [Lachnoanaerobaculum sp. JCM 36186]GMO02011.1 class I SAM-dependent DNA methyltransferase [Lachnoanaerobaculum sp. JCM 36186]
MAKKKTDEKTLNIDNILFNCRDYLRAARNSGSFFEKRDMMLTLVFLRFIGEKYEDGIEALRKTLIEQGLDPDDENIRAAFFDDATFADGTYNIPLEARWSTIINTPAPKLNVALDTALARLEEEDTQLKGCFIKGTFTTRNLAPNDIKKIVDEVNKISHKAFGAEKDLIGYVYEYFLKEFAVNATKEEGEFYTPHDVVQLIAAMIEPFEGTLYDPACGSGGMFIQSAELVKSKQGNLNSINIYGQEKEPATYRLAKMNLALRGISHNLGGESDSSFTHDLHKGLSFNYIMANPPFNLKGWYDENLKTDQRWADYVTPPESNANYAWILHILSHLKTSDGVAGFLLANGALNDSDTLEIRKRLIQNDKIEAIVVLPRELFITTDISVTLWILNQNKKGGKYHGRNLRNREHEILFMDLRQWSENAVKGENKKKVRLVSEQIERAADIYHTWQCEGTNGTKYEEPELYRSVGISEIEEKGWALTPSKYIEFIDHDLEIDYEKEMMRIQAEMKEIMKQEKQSQQMLEDAFRGIGYGID